MIDFIGELRRIMNADAGETYDPTTDSLEALSNWAAAGFAALMAASYRPSISLYEGWQDETGIDPLVWTLTNPAFGVPWARGAFGSDLMAASIPNANENARIRSNQRWIAGPDQYGPNRIITRFTLEFEAIFANVANFNNAGFLLGLTPNVGDTGASNNIIGWTLVGAGNALQTYSNAGGAVTSFTGFGENLANTNKFRIELFLFAFPGVGYSKWYLNDVLIATHIANNPSNAPMWINFYAPTGGVGAATIRLGIVRAWTEDIAR
jgi:hypothetical protein